MVDSVARITLDTSVWVNYLTNGDDLHPERLAPTRRVIEHGGRSAYRIVVPTLAFAEIAGCGDVRGSHIPPAERSRRITRVREWMTAEAPFLIVELHERLAHDAAELAVRHQLKGGDAVFLASAIATGSRALLSWDQDHLKLGSSLAGLEVLSPQQFDEGARDLLDLADEVDA